MKRKRAKGGMLSRDIEWALKRLRPIDFLRVIWKADEQVSQTSRIDLETSLESAESFVWLVLR